MRQKGFAGELAVVTTRVFEEAKEFFKPGCYGSKNRSRPGGKHKVREKLIGPAGSQQTRRWI